jgi:serine/threonine protein kinase/tetratricopeptide (TPR) repeat protein
MSKKTENHKTTPIDPSIEASAKKENGNQSISHYNHLRFLKGEYFINNQYQIKKVIGEGGFGLVLEAVDVIRRTNVALKFFNPEKIKDKKKFKRIIREANLLSEIEDEKILKVFALEQWKSLYFLVMELVKGKSLENRMAEKGKFEWEEFKKLFFQILEAVRLLHEKEIIHRDLNPSNIILTNLDKIKIVDFGLAKEITDTQKTSSTGEITGTPLYTSPEQAKGKELDFGSDIYQLGLILYRALSGKLPFKENTSPIAQMVNRVTESPEKISKYVDVPDFLEIGLEKALQKDKNQRFQSIREMLRFFKKEKVSRRKRAFFRLRINLFRYILFFLLFAALFILAFRFTLGRRTLHQVDTEGTRLIAKNRYGFFLWEKDFSPFTVYGGLVTKYLAGKNIPNVSHEKGIFAFLLHHPYPELPTDASINSQDYDNQLVILDSMGQLLVKYPFHQSFGIPSYDFPKTFSISSFEKKDVDNGSNLEAVMRLTQANGMYPSALVLFKGSEIYTFSNPGYLNEYRVVKTDKQPCTLLVLGQNHLVSGLSFLAELDFNSGPHIRGIPNLSPFTLFNIKGFLYFLPSHCQIIKNDWKDKGEISLAHSTRGEKLVLSHNYHLTVKSDDGEFHFKDNSKHLEKVYQLINRYYQAKMKHHDITKAYLYINEALDYRVENSYLKSALLVFKGDLEVASAEYHQGEHTLRQALHLYPYNMHAIRRIAEIKFLNSQPMEALQTIDKMMVNVSLSNEERANYYLFKVYCHLQVGNFAKAAALLKKSNRYPGMIEVFKGNYQEAFRLLKAVDVGQKKSFDIHAYRLLFARVCLLSGSELERAKFYFNDLFKFSLRFRQLAAVSVSYFLAKEGQPNEARLLAQNAFEKLLKISKGDVETRVWFFYDAYIYGKTMDILGNRKEALRGYRTSISANPHPELAQKSKIELKKLSTNSTKRR